MAGRFFEKASTAKHPQASSFVELVSASDAAARNAPAAHTPRVQQGMAGRCIEGFDPPIERAAEEQRGLAA
ncbi:MAG: hypothetical protein CTR53_04350 [Ferrovibrio sp.]|nr:MAG: hypothetical protein CTR53_04350 [Ferrovibrio sp.]